MAEKGSYTYDYPRPAVTVDMVVFTIQEKRLKVLLIQRGAEPFLGKWALPGGFVDPNEPLEAAARRELLEETSAEVATIRDVGAFGDPGRDPRGWVISAVFYALVPQQQLRVHAADDARAARCKSADKPPTMAFDHRKVLKASLERLRADLYTLAVAQPMLPLVFTRADLMALYNVLDPRTPQSEILVRRLLDASLIQPAEDDRFCFVGTR